MPRWEYCIERISETSVELLNDLGARGWELINISWMSWDESLGIAVFKREPSESLVRIVAPPTEALTEDGEPAQARKGLGAMKRRFKDGAS